MPDLDHWWAADDCLTIADYDQRTPELPPEPSRGTYGGTSTETGDWTLLALCRGRSQRIWYPEGNQGFSGDVYAYAREVCAQCEVRRPCLDDALSRRERFGCWGGLDPDQRDDLLGKPRLRRRQA